MGVTPSTLASPVPVVSSYTTLNAIHNQQSSSSKDAVSGNRNSNSSNSNSSNSNSRGNNGSGNNNGNGSTSTNGASRTNSRNITADNGNNNNNNSAVMNYYASYRQQQQQAQMQIQQQQQIQSSTFKSIATPMSMTMPMPIPPQFQNDPMAIHIHRDLPYHIIEHKLGPESGRMSATYRIRHLLSGSVMILKVMILSISNDRSSSSGNDSGSGSSNSNSNSNAHAEMLGKREYGSITQHELMLQEEELKRILLLVSSSNSHEHYNDDDDNDNANDDNGASVNDKHNKNNDNKTNHKNDFTHAILPYQSWYISPYNILSNTNTATITTTSNTNITNSSSSSNNNNNNISNNNNNSNNNTSNNTHHTHTHTKRPIYLLRPNIHTTLSIKIITRPFLSNSEKMYIAHQILKCIHELHGLGLCHGHLSCENIGLSSYHSVFLLDLLPICDGGSSSSSSSNGGSSGGSGGSSRTNRNNNRAVRPLLIPDDDPSDYIYYFQERTSSRSNQSGLRRTTNEDHHHGNNGGSSSTGMMNSNGGSGGGGGSAGSSSGIGSGGNELTSNHSGLDHTTSSSSNGGTMSTKTTSSSTFSGGEKKCYIAPERFVSSSSSKISSSSSSSSTANTTTATTTTTTTTTATTTTIPTKLTPAMDIFSLGCVLMELFLNGETAMDLGELMEYRRIKGNIATHSTLAKKLNKIESGKMRAAVRNMLHLDPAKRLSAGEYLNRLMATSTTTTTTTNTSANTAKANANANAASVGGTSSTKTSKATKGNPSGTSGTGTVAPLPPCHETVFFPFIKRLRCQILSPDARIALAAIHYEKVIYETVGIKDMVGGAYFRNIVGATTMKLLTTNEQHQQQQQQPQTMKKECNDAVQEEKQDHDQQYFSSLSFKYSLPTASITIDQTPSSDALIIFVQLILSTIRHTQRPSSKLVGMQLLGRISKYATDEVRLQRIVPTIVSILHDTDATVRAMSITVLASVLALIEHFPPSDAQVFPQYIFKKVSHLINDSALMVRVAFSESIAILAETALRFLDTCHAIKLYETVEGPSEEKSTSSKGLRREEKSNNYSTVLIRNDYEKYLLELQETVARWVVSITTDTSNYASALKQALLKDIARLCHFFGHDGVMACILPQVLAFLNYRRDWQLRAALCQHLPSICTMIGRAATEQFVVPCVETALIDEEERVISSALRCLAALVEMGLITRRILLGSRLKNNEENIPGIIKKYSALLVHPSDDVRYAASFFVATCCRSVRFPDDEVFLLPVIKPYLRYDIQRNRLQTSEGISSCLIPPSTKEHVHQSLRNEKNLRVLNDSIEGIQKAAFSCYVQNQKYAELLSNPLPGWYSDLKQTSTLDSTLESEVSSLRSMSTLSHVYGVSIMQPAHNAHSQSFFKNATTDSSMEILLKNSGNEKKLRDFLSDPLSRSFVAATKGEWGAQSLLDPALAEISQDVSKLSSLKVPVNPPHLGSLRNRDGRFYSCHTPVMASPHESRNEPIHGTEWKPKVDVLTCCSSPNEHNGPVSRLSVSQDQSFFVSGSHDGTCKIWETHQIMDSAGEICSSLTYDGHSNMNTTSERFGSRVNDVCIIENSHSVVSGDSNGVVQVWRVDTFAKNSITATDHTGLSTKTSGVSGSTMLRKVDPCEGEILSVSHFNTSATSTIAFATHRGIHSWDLRCAYEPFWLNLRPEYGHITSMAVGHDRNWIVAGSNRGYLALWDIRFQKLVKLWQHESGAPVNRLGTSFAALSGDNEPKPYVVMGCGLNETTVFDVSRGSCSHCFRVLDPALCYMDQSALPGRITSLPLLRDVNISSEMKRRVNGANDVFNRIINQRVPQPEPNIQSFTGRVGTSSENFLVTGGSDGFIHYWNFSSASKCFTISGLPSTASRPIYEKVGLGRPNGTPGSLFVCRQLPPPKLNEIPSVNVSKILQKGPTRPDNRHKDAILDIKKLDYPMKGILSCSRDNSIKFWR